MVSIVNYRRELHSTFIMHYKHSYHVLYFFIVIAVCDYDDSFKKSVFCFFLSYQYTLICVLKYWNTRFL